MKRSKVILLYIAVPAAACSILFILEQILLVDYVTKTIVKFILFLGIPLAAGYLFKEYKPLDPLKTLRNIPIKRLLPGACIGIAVIGLVTAVYMLVRSRIDTVSIVSELNDKSGITRQTYLLTGLYITFVNSFLEEWFFRGYLFSSLQESGMKYLAYTWSSILFSIYHLAIFNTWFTPPVMVLALLGLVAAGLFLDEVVRRTGTLLSSWLIHLSANIAIVGIGYTWLSQLY